MSYAGYAAATKESTVMNKAANDETGKRIKSERLKLGLNLEDAEAECCLCRNTILNLEKNGYGRELVHYVRWLSDKCGESLDYLLAMDKY